MNLQQRVVLLERLGNYLADEEWWLGKNKVKSGL